MSEKIPDNHDDLPPPVPISGAPNATSVFGYNVAEFDMMAALQPALLTSSLISAVPALLARTIDASGLGQFVPANRVAARSGLTNARVADLPQPPGGPANNIVISMPEPIIDPPVRLFCQYGGTWGLQPIRLPDKRNGPYGPLEDKSEGDPNNWADNGCYPTCLAMVLRWWCEDYPRTAGRVLFPGEPIIDQNFIGPPRPALTPPEMCRRFNGSDFFDCVQSNPLVARCPKCNTKFSENLNTGLCGGKCGTDLSQLATEDNLRPGHDTFSVDGSKVETFATKMTLDGINMSYLRFKCRGTADVIKTMTLKSMLSQGPMILNMSAPGHFVVVTGYRGNTIFVCDPGMILARGVLRKKPLPPLPPRWLGKTGQRRPIKAGCNESFGGDSDTRGYVTIPDDKKDEQGRTWLSIVSAMDQLTFPNAGPNFSWDRDPDPSLVCP